MSILLVKLCGYNIRSLRNDYFHIVNSSREILSDMYELLQTSDFKTQNLSQVPRKNAAFAPSIILRLRLRLHTSRLEVFLNTSPSYLTNLLLVRLLYGGH